MRNKLFSYSPCQKIGGLFWNQLLVWAYLSLFESIIEWRWNSYIYR